MSSTTRRPRPGLAGHWDRLVGPDATAGDNIATLAFTAVGAVLGFRLCGPGPTASGRCRGRRLLVAVLAADLWGGAWANNTAACRRWYHRPGQGPRQQLLFAAAHLHPLVLGSVLHPAGPRAGLRYGAGHYVLMLAGVAAVATGPPSARFPLAVAATTLGCVRDRRGGGPLPGARWLAPVYYAKLVLGHALGPTALPPDPRW